MTSNNMFKLRCSDDNSDDNKRGPFWRATAELVNCKNTLFELRPVWYIPDFSLFIKHVLIVFRVLVLKLLRVQNRVTTQNCHFPMAKAGICLWANQMSPLWSRDSSLSALIGGLSPRAVSYDCLEELREFFTANFL